MAPSDRFVVVTGADGFIGRALLRHWTDAGRSFRAVVRQPRPGVVEVSQRVVVADLATAGADMLDALVDGATAIVHLAGRAHVMTEAAADPEAAYRAANVESTVRLAQAAVRAGVPYFIFASSIKVNGEASPQDRPFRPDDPPAPHDAYARTKLDAERALFAATAGTTTHATALRLPLVYGPGVRANFLALIDAVAGRRWLPLAALSNRRSLLYLDNLLNAIDAAVDVPAPLAGVHFVADEPPVTVPELVRTIGEALAVPVRLFPVPVALLRVAGSLAGRRDAIARLTEPLVVDSGSFRSATGWTSTIPLREGVAATVRWWRSRHVL